MSHHSSDGPFDPKKISEYSKFWDAIKRDDADPHVARQALRRKLLDTTGFRGEIGAYPNGKLGPNDEGAIQFGIAVVDGRVVIDFGKPVFSLGMTPQEAADMASHIMRVARQAAIQKGVVVSFSL